MAHTTGRYTGAFESRFEQDAARLSDLKPGNADGYIQVLSKITDDTLTTDYWLITPPNDLATSASKSLALLAYIAALNILDADALLSTGKVRGRLDPAITAKKGIERPPHFPQGLLCTQLKITDNRDINQIANMALSAGSITRCRRRPGPPVRMGRRPESRSACPSRGDHRQPFLRRRPVPSR
jgi:hypothetical protein